MSSDILARPLSPHLHLGIRIMTPGAGVRSLDALKDWYAALALFRNEAQNAQTSLALALQRAADFLGEQQVVWQRRIRKAEEDVTQAKAELRHRRLLKDFDGRHPDTTVQEKNLARALDGLRHAEDRLDVTRRWLQRLPTVIRDVYDGPARGLSFFVEIDLARALAELAKQLTALELYVGLQPVASPAPPPKKDTP
jgi:hypothetical protein